MQNLALISNLLKKKTQISSFKPSLQQESQWNYADFHLVVQYPKDASLYLFLEGKILYTFANLFKSALNPVFFIPCLHFFGKRFFKPY